jgi:hypothetical protein
LNIGRSGGIGGLDLAGVKQVTQKFTDKKARWEVSDYNVFKLNLVGATRASIPRYENGRITPVECFVKGEKRLPVIGMFATLIDVLGRHNDIETIVNKLKSQARVLLSAELEWLGVHHAVQALEVMVNDGWVLCKLDKRKPRLILETPVEGDVIHTHREQESCDRAEKS